MDFFTCCFQLLWIQPIFWIFAFMMSRNNYYERYNYDFTARIQVHGYMYSWKVAVEELRVQAKLARLDMENYIKYNRGYNKTTVAEMAED